MMRRGRTYFSQQHQPVATETAMKTRLQRGDRRIYPGQRTPTTSGTLRLGDQLRMRSSHEDGSTGGDDSQKVYLMMRIAGKNRASLLDTGCEVTVIPSRLVKRRAIRHTTRNLIAANGTEVPILGSATLKAYIGDTEVLIRGLVSEHVVDIMLGIDWLQENNVLWDFVRGEVTIEGVSHKLSAKRTRGSWCRRVILARDVTVPPSSQIDLPTKMVYRELRTVDEEKEDFNWTTENSEVKRGLLVARTLLPNRAEEVPVRVLNASKAPIHLCRGTFVSDLHPVTPVEVQAEQPTAKVKEMKTEEEIVEELMSKVDSEVSEDIKQKLKIILDKYSCVFS